jgi:hypothetical protein
MRFKHRRFSVVMLWVLIPVTFVGSFPRLQCICAASDPGSDCDGTCGHCATRPPARSQVPDGCPACQNKNKLVTMSGSGRQTEVGEEERETWQHASIQGRRCRMHLAGTVRMALTGVPVASIDAQLALSPEALIMSPKPAISKPDLRLARNPRLPVPDLLIAHQTLVI